MRNPRDVALELGRLLLEGLLALQKQDRETDAVDDSTNEAEMANDKEKAVLDSLRGEAKTARGDPVKDRRRE